MAQHRRGRVHPRWWPLESRLSADVAAALPPFLLVLRQWHLTPPLTPLAEFPASEFLRTSIATALVMERSSRGRWKVPCGTVRLRFMHFPH